MKIFYLFILFLITNFSVASTNAQLVSLWEEEKLAHDVYFTLNMTYNSRVFTNISRSEVMHMNSVEDLLLKNGGTVPSNKGTVGLFYNPKYQELYNKLTSQGKVSFREAMLVGLSIEELDIKDLDQMLLNNNIDEEIVVLQALKEASLRHKAAFERNL